MNSPVTQAMREELEWHEIKLAPADEIVWTMIHDDYGARNVQKLKRVGRLWWLPDMSMYVDYTPTHWRRSLGNHEIDADLAKELAKEPSGQEREIVARFRAKAEGREP